MQTAGPYRLQRALSSCEVGDVWSAVDDRGRSVTVAVLNERASVDERWRDAFAAATDALGGAGADQLPIVGADHDTARPWVACAIERGAGAAEIFSALGQRLRPAGPPSGPVADPHAEHPTVLTPLPPQGDLPTVLTPLPAQQTSAAPAANGASSDAAPAQLGPTQPDPAQPVPAQPVSAQPGPTQPDPAQPDPTQSYPAQPVSAQPGPAQPVSAQPGPAQPGPAQRIPGQPGPAQQAPAQPASAWSRADQPGEVRQPDPVRPTPVDAAMAGHPLAAEAQRGDVRTGSPWDRPPAVHDGHSTVDHDRTQTMPTIQPRTGAETRTTHPAEPAHPVAPHATTAGPHPESLDHPAYPQQTHLPAQHPAPAHPDATYSLFPPSHLADPLAPVSGASVSGASVSGASVPGASVSGAPISGASVSGLPVSGDFGYPQRSRIFGDQPPAKPRRNGLLLGVVALVALLAGAGGAVGIMALADDGDPPAPAPSSAPAQLTPQQLLLPAAPPTAPGVEPPQGGGWPSGWPGFTSAESTKPMNGLEGVGFDFRVPPSWSCTKTQQAEAAVRYRCGVGTGATPANGGELIVRNCATPCAEEYRTTLRKQEEAWGLRWTRSGPFTVWAETTQINGKRVYGLVYVAFWRSAPEGAIDRQLVLRMTTPLATSDDLKKVANSIRDRTFTL